MFRSLRINIFIYYCITVCTFLVILHYLLTVIEIQNILLLTVVMLCFVILSAIFISKLAIDPLVEYVKNLQNLSKETLHELNLPISTIKTNSQMIKKNSIDEKTLKRLTRIDSACTMLQQRYNELDYMIKRQTQQNIKESINLDELVKKRVKFLNSIYSHIEFILELENTKIVGDEIGLSKIIDNIIDNGVKYSPNSKKIDIKLINYRLYIKDYGCGMDEVELLRIFDNYYQSDESMQGFGIGLGMVKRFCDNQGIRLSFISKPNIGTTVLLKFKEN
ncbi:MAG: HAMP domain-containing sensor histidine kinase [Campylobacterota bacterium]|nr:HAMP domain-containing sensor histidine kinase [Campylobacterota bacterium]